jgi:hypothetical protein
MQAPSIRALIVVVLISSILLLSSCSAGSEQFTPENPAGFWYGLWHGAISVIALIIHVFAESVKVYEINNAGGWYDFGFLLGILCVWGGSSHICCKSEKERKREEEWDKIADKVEIKVMRKMKEWAEEEEEEGGEVGKEWEEIGDKVEKKLKRKIREWAEKE